MNIRYLTNSLLSVFVGLVELFLALRFILKLFGANAANGFVSWIYEMSGVLLEPFRGIFPIRVYENSFVFEFSTLFAMLMYALLAVIVMAFIDLITAPLKKSK
jgi:uncharacterized protein YggT (Ycf19 family)